MLCWVQVWTLAGPLQNFHRVFPKALLCFLGGTVWVVVLLKYKPLPQPEIQRFGLTTCSDTHFYEYHHFNLSLTWTEAQRYCREKYTDLVTIESTDDLSRLNRPSPSTEWSWIGLNDDPKSWKGVMGNDANSWRWSATGETSETDYQNWYSGQPNDIGNQACLYIYIDGKWLDDPCQSKLSFVCFNGEKMLCLLI
uniref:C-type lectin domain-containing protein n=1 Tax=Seriola lalandi dorsalis TaxID=1841481 RepID=A0A3B4XXD9_SERLL